MIPTNHMLANYELIGTRSNTAHPQVLVLRMYSAIIAITLSALCTHVIVTYVVFNTCAVYNVVCSALA